MVLLTDDVVENLKKYIERYMAEKDYDEKIMYANQLVAALNMALICCEYKEQDSKEKADDAENNGIHIKPYPYIITYPIYKDYCGTPIYYNPPYEVWCRADTKTGSVSETDIATTTNTVTCSNTGG